MFSVIFQAREMIPAYPGERICDTLEAAHLIHQTIRESTDGHTVRAFTVRIRPDIAFEAIRKLVSIGDEHRFLGWRTGGGTPEYEVLLFINEAAP